MELDILENKVVVAAPPPPLAGWRGYCWHHHWKEGGRLLLQLYKAERKGEWVAIIIIAMFPGCIPLEGAEGGLLKICSPSFQW